MSDIKLRPLTREEWDELGQWSAKLHARDYEGCVETLDAVLDSDDYLERLAILRMTGMILVKRLLGADESVDAGQQLLRIVGPAIQELGRYSDLPIPDDELLDYLSTGNAAMDGRGPKSGRSVLIALGVVLTLYREELFEEVGSAMNQVARMWNER